ncbi:hypothetical protein H9L12_08330 [Sphingomonas rhizophila]|uniref:Uncharacterized protein n=1 Tax=Sphingomonas rhizophila TaxID=2071607 RepID=A0A7G9S913_9SPHN|nr:hypothetical protein [Sphingomonas rhizophila]QNN64338.1 hypothetical protein H9L12_08330 [Sphingomonas rhizophila]
MRKTLSGGLVGFALTVFGSGPATAADYTIVANVTGTEFTVPCDPQIPSCNAFTPYSATVERFVSLDLVTGDNQFFSGTRDNGGLLSGTNQRQAK